MPGLYVHIPFCVKKCHYCDFYSVTALNILDDFVQSCAKEIEMRAGESGIDIEFTSIFFGGGTPSLLEPAQLEKIVSALRHSFRLVSDAEFTVECNPGTVSKTKLNSYREIGVNRLSFGVQSFHEQDLRFLERIHTPADAVECIKTAYDAGFENIGIDLMFSLPGQNKSDWILNLEHARDLNAQHISCYSLTVENGTPLARMMKEGGVLMPSEESDAEIYEITMETLSRWEYRQYEVSNFALNGFECRHNLSYWRHEDYLGFGPSAHSTWRNHRFWNTDDIYSYLDSIRNDKLPVSGGEELSRSMLQEEYIYLRLRSEGIYLEDFRKRFEADILNDNAELIGRCANAGLLEETDGFLRLSRKGFLLCDEICAEMR